MTWIEEDYLETLLFDMWGEFTREYKDDIIRVYKEAIILSIYSRPAKQTVWRRTYNLLDSVDIEIDDNNLQVYVGNNFENSHYYSAYNSNRYIGDVLLHFLNEGHSSNSDSNNLFENYPATNYLSMASELIEQLTGYKPTIINEKPPKV